MDSEPSSVGHQPATPTTVPIAIVVSDTILLDIVDQLPQSIGLLPHEAALLWAHLSTQIIEILKGKS